MSNSDGHESTRALSYTEMMNEGRQNLRNQAEPGDHDLKQRIEELERKVEHLQSVIQRQVRQNRAMT